MTLLELIERTSEGKEIFPDGLLIASIHPTVGWGGADRNGLLYAGGFRFLLAKCCCD